MNVQPDNDFARLRNRLLNDTLLWIGIASIPSAALSLARFFIIGLRPLMLLHVVLLSALWLMWFNRQRISYRSRTLGLLAVLWLAAFAGLAQLGPVAAGGLFIILFAFIAILFLGGKLAWWLIAGNGLCMALFGLAATLHWLDFDLNYQVYSHHPLTWLNIVWTITAYSFIFALFGWRMIEWLLQRGKELRQKRDLTQHYLDTVQTIMVSLDSNGHITMINRKGCELLGYKENELIGRNWFEHCLPQPSGMATAYPLFLNIMSGHVLRADESCEIPVLCRNGEERLVDWHNAYLTDDTGKITGSLCSGEDITESKRMQERERSHNYVLKLLSKGTPLTEILDVILHDMNAQNPALMCSIQLLDDEGKHLLTGRAPSLPDFYNVAISGIEIGEGIGSCGTAAFRGERVIVEDVQIHPYWTDFKELANRSHLRSCWSEPIKNSSGKVLGTFTIYKREVASPGESDILLLEYAANLAGVAIEHSRSMDELKLSSLVYQTSSEAIAIADTDNRIITINPAFTEMMGYTLDEVIGKNPNILSSGRQDEAFYREMWGTLNTVGRWQGEVWNRRKNGDFYAARLTINTIHNDDGSIYRRVALFSDITEKKKNDELIWQQANFDALTNLPNRRMAHDRLEQEIRKSKRKNLPLALFLIDLDQFKEINDTLGHDMGDILLQEAAQRMVSCVRNSDTVARLGGDEFIIILSELDDIGSIERIADNLLIKLAAPFQLKRETGYISASIGITLYPDDATDVITMLKNADQAMYAAKHEGRNRFRYYSPAMQEAASSRIMH